MIRPRDRSRRDWPPGLREPRPGYFTWRNPATGQEMAIGRVTLAQAKREAMEANDYVLSQRPTLLERLTGSGNTVADLLDKMPVPEKANTAKSLRSLDKKIRAALGTLYCHGLTVKHCADLIEGESDAGRAAPRRRCARAWWPCAPAGRRWAGWRATRPSRRRPSPW
jgi:hypothetical protein